MSTAATVTMTGAVVTMGAPYAGLEELKRYLSIDGETRFDEGLSAALDSVSREIERHCNRQFHKDVVASAREYDADTARSAAVDDFWTTDGLIVETGNDFTTVWGPTDYRLRPLNGIVDGQAGWPFHRVQAAPLGRYRFGTAGVRVTAQWGWDEVPAPVHQACLIMAAATFQIKDSPFGVAGSDQFGTIRVRDNQMAATKLARYVANRILVG